MLRSDRQGHHPLPSPTPATTLLRNALLLVWCAASWVVLSCEANAQDAFAPTDRNAGCAVGTPSTVSCVRKYMITDDQLRETVAYNSLPNHLEKIVKELGRKNPSEYTDIQARFDGIRQYAVARSAEMAIPAPALYVSMLSTQAAETLQGKNFVAVNKDAFKAALLTDAGAQKLKLSLAREFAHIRNGDTSPSAVADHRNNPSASREAELRAELEGAGPLGTGDPIAATTAIKDNLRKELQRLVFRKHIALDELDSNRLSDRDYKRISDEHTRIADDVHNLAPWDRVVALRREARLMAEYEQSHAVLTHSEREAESKWLVDQILLESQCPIQMDPTTADKTPCYLAHTAR